MIRAGNVAAKTDSLSPPIVDDDDYEPPEWVQEEERQEAERYAREAREREKCLQDEQQRERAAQLARQYARPKNWPNIGSFADNFPATFRILTRYSRKGRVLWPHKAHDHFNRPDHVIKAFLESEDVGEREYIFHFMNDALAADFAPTWTADEFESAFLRLEAAHFEQTADDGPINRGGRKRTDQTMRVKMICDALGCGSRHAYRIDAEGTAKIDDQIELAKAFKNDPARCLPRDWEPKFKDRGWGRFSERSFRRYVESGADLFEDDIGAPLAILSAQYAVGGFPINFQDVRALIAAIERAGLAIDPRMALAIFSGFEDWKRPRRSR